MAMSMDDTMVHHDGAILWHDIAAQVCSAQVFHANEDEGEGVRACEFV